MELRLSGASDRREAVLVELDFLTMLGRCNMRWILVKASFPGLLAMLLLCGGTAARADYIVTNDTNQVLIVAVYHEMFDPQRGEVLVAYGWERLNAGERKPVWRGPIGRIALSVEPLGGGSAVVPFPNQGQVAKFSYYGDSGFRNERLPNSGGRDLLTWGPGFSNRFVTGDGSPLPPGWRIATYYWVGANAQNAEFTIR
jgi:hypothetical protein